KEIKGLLALKEDVPELDEDASAKTPQQKHKCFDELEIIAKDLGLTLTTEEQTFYGAVIKESGSTNSGVEVMSEGAGPGQVAAGSGAVGKEDGSKAPIFHHTLWQLTEFQTAPLSIKSLDPVHDIGLGTAIVGTLTSMIMHCQSQRHNYFQRIMGIFFHASGCSKDIINTLAKAHICISYDSTLAAISALTEDAIGIVREAVLKNNWYIIYDNINLFMTVTDQ
ncbi:hypothetical protein CPB97_003500, partial [Podila verticillata]